MKSIIQKAKKCYFCGQTQNLNLHHVVGGTARRKISDQEGLVVWLCNKHHTSSEGVHRNRELDLILKREAQRKYEETHTREEFISKFRRNYLD